MKTLLILLSLLTVNVWAQSIESYLEPLDKLKKGAEANIDQSPYQKAQQESFKKYFIELSILIEDLDEYPKLKSRYQNYVSSNGVKAFCEELFLPKAEWERLIQKCTKNRFFLCAEEVKAFGTYKAALKDRLTEAMKEHFLKEPSCEI